MQIAVIGVNHNKAPIEVREKVSFTESQKIDAINILLDKNINEVIILSTCNRSEIYIAAENANKAVEEIKGFYKEFFDLDEIESYFFVDENENAIKHIFNVALGIESIVLGEDQILGQVKDALQFSMELGASKKVLNKLFREAITCAKEVKTSYRISEIPLSTSYIGVKLLREKLGTLKGKKALLIGIGHISNLSLKYLGEEELDTIYITNRTHGKLIEIPMKFSNAKIINYDERYSIIEDVDIIITATSAPHTILKCENMPKCEKELYIMDLAVPRDVDKEIANMKNINLFDIDDLSKISYKNMKKREQLCNSIEKIVYVKVVEFLDWLRSIKIDPIISKLNNKCSIIEKDTLEFLDRKLDLESRDKKLVEKMINSALKRIIRDPILKLKAIEEDNKMEEYTKVVADIFDI